MRPAPGAHPQHPTVDLPARFRNSKAVGAVLGLTPSTGAISKCGDEMMRVMLYEAAQSLLVHSTKWSWLKAWAWPWSCIACSDANVG